MKLDQIFGAVVLAMIVWTADGCGKTKPAPVVEQTTVAPSIAPVHGPVPGGRLMEEYVKQVGRSAYLWAWPMVKIGREPLFQNHDS
jgi:hypothetical protein